jgi:hypothetical protein
MSRGSEQHGQHLAKAFVKPRRPERAKERTTMIKPRGMGVLVHPGLENKC